MQVILAKQRGADVMVAGKFTVYRLPLGNPYEVEPI
jgi:hypothetical protein